MAKELTDYERGARQMRQRAADAVLSLRTEMVAVYKGAADDGQSRIASHYDSMACGASRVHAAILRLPLSSTTEAATDAEGELKDEQGLSP